MKGDYHMKPFEDIYARFVELEIIRRSQTRKLDLHRRDRDRQNAKANTDRKWLAMNKPIQWIR